MNYAPSLAGLTRGSRATFILAVLSALAVTAGSQEPPAAPAPGAMRETSPGVFELGKVRLDKNARTVSFPGILNMDKGLLEYLLVGPGGSTHESLLVSDIPPQDVHLAMVLLGAKGAGIAAPAPDQAPPAQITEEYLKTAPKLKGDSIKLAVKWKAKDEAEKTAPVEDWLLFLPTEKPPEPGAWIYSGSMFGADGNFLAQQQQLFAALITNPGALINTSHAGNNNDEAWAVNQKTVPPVQTPVEIIFQLAPATPAAPAGEKPATPTPASK